MTLAVKNLRWRNETIPGQHEGVSVTSTAGVATIDLGLRHNNFSVVITLMGGATELATAFEYMWDYHATKKGTFVLTVFKRPAAYGAWIAATTAVRFSFVAHEKPKEIPVT